MIDSVSLSDDDTYANASLPYDSIVYKFACCIPFLGLIPQIIIDYALDYQVCKTTDVKKLVSLIELKNDYLFCGVINTMLLTAMAIHVVVVAGILFGTATVLGVYGLHHNQWIISELMTTGYRQGINMEVW